MNVIFIFAIYYYCNTFASLTLITLFAKKKFQIFIKEKEFVKENIVFLNTQVYFILDMNFF